MRGPILLVGCGKMGGALLRGWLGRGLAIEDALVVEPGEGSAEAARSAGVRVVGTPADVPDGFAPRVVVLAVKPQAMAEVAPHYRRFARGEAMFLSIAAGTTLAGLARHLGDGARIVRAMPNTPAAVGRGMTVLCAGPGVSDAQRELCGALMEAVGEVAWVTDEELLHAVTALSGGGPAYVFLLIECLARAGEDSGLPADLAMRLACMTVVGSAELARLSSEPASTLRENVTSPGGTTLAALRVLMAPDGLQPLLSRAIAAAAARSRELGA